MKTYLDCWISGAKALFSQALAGEPQLSEQGANFPEVRGPSFTAELTGVYSGRFTVTLESAIVDVPFFGEGVDQLAGWEELLREVAESAAGELLAASGQACRIEAFRRVDGAGGETRRFRVTSDAGSWMVVVQDDLQLEATGQMTASAAGDEVGDGRTEPAGVDLLLDIELEAALRFGCCEMPLEEILKLGPGDVVELDRHVTDPVDLVVGDKIVARGEVVLINGNFGLRVSEVAAPQKRLESIRCLF